MGKLSRSSIGLTYSAVEGKFWTPIDAGSFALDPGLLYSIRFRAARQPPVEDYLPEHNARFAKPAALPETAFVAVADKSALAETLCLQEECVPLPAFSTDGRPGFQRDGL
jgi:hypothetical protein